MLKFGRVFLMTLLLMMCFGIPAAAVEFGLSNSEIEGFMDRFALDEEDLVYRTTMAFGFSYHQFLNMENLGLEDNNVFGDFVFGGGLERTSLSTFATRKSLLGYGSEGMNVGYVVYRHEGDELKVSDADYRTLGASGLYQTEISFEEKCVQYLVIAVQDGSTVIHRVFEVTTMGEDDRFYLENIRIEFREEEENEPEEPFFVIPSLDGLEL